LVKRGHELNPVTIADAAAGIVIIWIFRKVIRDARLCYFGLVA